MIAFLAGPIGRWLVMAALVLAAMGWAYMKGVSRESDRRDAEALAQERLEHERYAGSVKIGRDAARLLQGADIAAMDYRQKWRQTSDKLSKSVPLIVAGPCAVIGPEKPVSDGRPRLADPGPAPVPNLRLSWALVSLYDGAWTGSGGQPVFGDPTRATPAANNPGAASPYGPADLLANHEENAARCSADRRALGQLNDVIDKLEAKWDREHK